MGNIVVECNPTEDSVVVVILLMDSPKSKRSQTIEWNNDRVKESYEEQEF